MKTSRFYISLFCIALFTLTIHFLYPPSASAQEEKNSIIVDGQSLSYGEVISSFFDVAFTDAVWNEDAWSKDREINSPKGDGFSELLTDAYASGEWGLSSAKRQEWYQRTKKYSPWWAEQMHMVDGLPRNDAINKWQGKITIGIGWPKYNPTNPYTSETFKEHLLEENKKGYELAEKAIESMVPALKEATGMEVEFFKPTDAREFTEEYARIRVIPSNGIGARMLGFPRIGSWYADVYENMTWGGILFEDSGKDFMDGYIFSGADNVIDLAICKIKTERAEKVFIATAQKCLIRALGLPGKQDVAQYSMLGGWTEFHSLENYDPFKIGEPEPIRIPKTGISDFDKLMAKLLYCPSIKPQMDKNAVLDLIMKQDACIAEKLKH